MQDAQQHDENGTQGGEEVILSPESYGMKVHLSRFKLRMGEEFPIPVIVERHPRLLRIGDLFAFDDGKCPVEYTDQVAQVEQFVRDSQRIGRNSTVEAALNELMRMFLGSYEVLLEAWSANAQKLNRLPKLGKRPVMRNGKMTVHPWLAAGIAQLALQKAGLRGTIHCGSVCNIEMVGRRLFDRFPSDAKIPNFWWNEVYDNRRWTVFSPGTELVGTDQLSNVFETAGFSQTFEGLVKTSDLPDGLQVDASKLVLATGESSRDGWIHLRRERRKKSSIEPHIMRYDDVRFGMCIAPTKPMVMARIMAREGMQILRD